MSDELAVLPRRELQRALGMATTNAVSGGAIMTPGVMAVAVGLLLTPPSILALGLLLATGAVFGAYGGITLVRALRARVAIRAKLRAQELPGARLLAPGAKH